MNKPLYHGDTKLGYFQVEHNAGNRWAWCHYLYGDTGRITITDFEGHKAIQHVLDYMAKFDYETFAKTRAKYQEVP